MKRFKVKRMNSMAQNWDYAELSKAAKAVGGPEKYVEMLELASKEAGKKEMFPWLGAAAVKKKNVAETAKAKEEIINGIKEYDAMHSEEEGGNEDE